MKIEFSTDGAAFKDGYADELTNEYIRDDEVVRILNLIITYIRCGDDHGPIMDINGNKIGEWSL
jgi:hypothetical protein